MNSQATEESCQAPCRALDCDQGLVALGHHHRPGQEAGDGAGDH